MSDARGSEDSVADRFRENAVSIVSTLVTAVWMAALFTGQSWWLAALLVGYVVVVPVTSMLFGDDGEGSERPDHDERSSEAEETPLETLRRRYAEGELSEAQFEHKLDQLLETETIEDAEAYAGRRDRERGVERER